MKSRRTKVKHKEVKKNHANFERRLLSEIHVPASSSLC